MLSDYPPSTPFAARGARYVRAEMRLRRLDIGERYTDHDFYLVNGDRLEPIQREWLKWPLWRNKVRPGDLPRYRAYKVGHVKALS